MKSPEKFKKIMTIQLNDLNDIERLRLTELIAKSRGFFTLFFENLPDMSNRNKSQKSLFEKINQLHYDIFGEYMYSSYKSFHKQYSRHLKNHE